MKLLVLIALCGLLGASARCANDCNGHGTCGAHDMCTCFQNWQSADCSERTCQFGLAFIDTPQGDLDGENGVEKGTSINGAANSGLLPVQWSTALQYEYYPTDAADGEAHFYRECSNKGHCDRKTGICDCFDGYEGVACERTVCPNACSGHGTCESIAELALQASSSNPHTLWDADKTMACKCDPEYSGPDCSLRECPKGDDPLTTTDSNDAVQTITLTASADDLTGQYKLTFTDQFGDKWTTVPITVAKHATLATQATAVKAALEALPNNRIEGVSVTQEASGDNGVLITVTFDKNSGVIPALVCETAVQNVPFAAGDAVTGFTSSLAGTSPTCTVATSTAGNKEEATCSNRGLCDYTTGLCKCFKGYTLDDCSAQNALAY